MLGLTPTPSSRAISVAFDKHADAARAADRQPMSWSLAGYIRHSVAILGESDHRRVDAAPVEVLRFIRHRIGVPASKYRAAPP